MRSHTQISGRGCIQRNDTIVNHLFSIVTINVIGYWDGNLFLEYQCRILLVDYVL